MRHKNMIGNTSDQIDSANSNNPLLWGIVLTLLISVFLRINTILNLGNILYDANVNSILLYSISFSLQFVMGFVLVILLLPSLMSDPGLINSIRTRTKPSRILILAGIISGSIFLLLAAVISNIMRIPSLDFSILIAKPDVYVEPDVAGWYYFILALVPAIWEEIVFRGIILFQLRNRYSDKMAILVSSLLFSLYHFSVIVSRPLDAVIGGVIMSFFYGLAWGSLVLKFNSILPAMIAHYIIDAIGIVFLNVDTSDPVLTTQYMLLITILYPLVHWLIFKFVKDDLTNTFSDID